MFLLTAHDPYTFFSNVNPFVLVCVGITAVVTCLITIFQLFTKPYKFIKKALQAALAIHNVIFGYTDPNTKEEIRGLLTEVKEIKTDLVEVKTSVLDIKTIADDSKALAGSNNNKLINMDARQKRIELNTKQLTPNGGGHMLDTINKINATVNPETEEIKELDNE
jgi:hypothetical protein